MASEKDIQKALASLGAARIQPASLTPKPKPSKRIGYREAISYIAYNDDEGMLRVGDPSVVVSMVAHLFGKDEQLVITDVLRYLEKHDG